MKYFSLAEFEASDTARRLGIDNRAAGAVRANITALVANVLDPLREAYGAPIVVSSGYRCTKLNKAVGGSATSQHLTGQAADIRCVSRSHAENKKIWDLLLKLKLPYDQLIWEYGSAQGPQWIHVSYSASRNRRQILKKP